LPPVSIPSRRFSSESSDPLLLTGVLLVMIDQTIAAMGPKETIGKHTTLKRTGGHSLELSIFYQNAVTGRFFGENAYAKLG